MRPIVTKTVALAAAIAPFGAYHWHAFNNRPLLAVLLAYTGGALFVFGIILDQDETDEATDADVREAIQTAEERGRA
jgi:hypothetical protein